MPKETINKDAVEIIYLLNLRGLTQQDIADLAGVGRSMVSQVIQRQKKSRRVATVIAAQTGKNLEELWPGTYTRDFKGRLVA